MVEPMWAADATRVADLDKKYHSYYDPQLDCQAVRPGYWTAKQYQESATANKPKNRCFVVKDKKLITGVLIFAVEEEKYHITKMLSIRDKEQTNRYLEILNFLKQRAASSLKIVSITAMLDDYDYDLLKFLKENKFKLKLLPNKEQAFSDKWFCSLKL